VAEPLVRNDEQLNGAIPTVLIPGTKRTVLGSYVWKEHRWRIIWNRMHYRPLDETFHDFLINLMRGTLGKDWVVQQAELAPGERHVVARWLDAFKNIPNSPLRIGDGVYVPSGQMRSALSFAYDLYLLQIDNKLPESLIARLRDRVAFQGARYEVAIASIFVRADFDITLLDASIKNTKHCEFVAKHKVSNNRLSVEAKSRVRRGVLNQPGSFDEDKDVKGDVRGLYVRSPKRHVTNRSSSSLTRICPRTACPRLRGQCERSRSSRFLGWSRSRRC
jgi:hypothetical protein